MLGFNRKKRPEIVVDSTATSRVEVEVARDASKKAKAKADEANAHLSELLEENGFTIKIALAASSSIKKKTGRNR